MKSVEYFVTNGEATQGPFANLKTADKACEVLGRKDRKAAWVEKYVDGQKQEWPWPSTIKEI